MIRAALIFALAFVVALVDATCISPTLLKPNYVVNERNASLQLYPLVNQTFNLVNPPNCRATGKEIIFSFTPSATAQYILRTANDGIDTVMDVFNPAGCMIVCNDDQVPNVMTNSYIVLDATKGANYLIVVEAFFLTESRSVAFFIDLVASNAPTMMPTASPVTLPPTLGNYSLTIIANNVQDFISAVESAKPGQSTLVVLQSDIDLGGVAIQVPANTNIQVVSRMRTVTVRSDVSDLQVIQTNISQNVGFLSINRTLNGLVVKGTNFVSALGDVFGTGVDVWAAVSSSVGQIMLLDSSLSFRTISSQVNSNLQLQVGASIFPVGDVNNDGFDDFCIVTKANSILGLIYGGITGGSLGDLIPEGGSYWFSIGDATNQTQVSKIGPCGDVNGFGDFIVSYVDVSQGNSYLLLVFGESTCTSNTDQSQRPRTSLIQPLFNDGAILAFSLAGDLDGDGLDDVLVGHPTFERVYVFFGSRDIPRDYFLSPTTDSNYEDANQQTLFGSDVTGGSDFDGNLELDFAVGAPQAFNGKGAVYLFLNRKFIGVNNRQLSDLVLDFAQPTDSIELKWDNTSATKNCGSVVRLADLDGDSNADLILACSDKVLVVFGASQSLFVSSMSLLSFMDGYKGYVIDVTQVTKIDVRQDSTSSLPDMLLTTSNGTIVYLSQPGRKRKGFDPVFIVGENASLTVEGVRLMGTNTLVRADKSTSVTTIGVFLDQSPSCPLGFTQRPNTTICYLTWTCSPVNMTIDVISKGAVFPTLPLDPFRIVSCPNCVLVVTYRAGQLMGRFLSENEFVIESDLALQSDSFLLADVDVNVGRLEGTQARLFDVATLDDVSRFLVIFLDSTFTLKARIVDCQTHLVSESSFIMSLADLGPIVPGGFVPPPPIWSISTLPSVGRVFIALSYQNGSNSITSRAAVSTTFGASFREISIGVASTTNLQSWPPTDLRFIPPTDGVSSPTSNNGGFLLTSIDDSIDKKRVMVLSMNSFLDSIFTTKFVDLNFLNVTNGPSLILPQIATIQVKLGCGNGTFVVVCNAGSLLRVFLLRKNAQSWTSSGLVRAKAIPFSSLIDILIVKQQTLMVVFGDETGTQLQLAVNPNFGNSSFSSPTVVYVKSPSSATLETGYDLKPHLLSGSNLLAVSELYTDGLGQMTSGSEVSSLVQSSLGLYQGYLIMGLPMRSSLSMVSYSTGSSVCATTELAPLPFCEICGVNCLGACQPAPTTSMIQVSQLALNVTSPLPSNGSFTLTMGLFTRGKLSCVPPSLPDVILTTSEGREVEGVVLIGGQTVSLGVQVITSKPSPLSFICSTSEGDVNVLNVQVTYNTIVPILSPSTLQLVIGSSAELTISNVGSVYLIVKLSPCDEFVIVLEDDIASVSPGQSLRAQVQASDQAGTHSISCVRVDYHYALPSSLSFDPNQAMTALVSATFVATGSSMVQQDCQSGTYFVGGTCVLCGIGLYQPEPASLECLSCPPTLPLTMNTGSTSMDDCIAAPNSFKFNSTLGLVCPVGADCSQLAGSSLTNLTLLKGYWRASVESYNLFKCRHVDYCIGSQSTISGRRLTSTLEAENPRRVLSVATGPLPTDTVCRTNHTGILCEGCLQNSYKRNGYCEYCDSDTTAADRSRAIGIYVGITLIFLALLIVCYLVANDLCFQRQANESTFWEFGLWGALGMKLRLIVSLLQVVDLYAVNAPELYPSEFFSFATAFGIFYLDPQYPLNLGCAFANTMPNNPLYSVLLVATIAPVVGLVLCALCGLIARFSVSVEAIKIKMDLVTSSAMFILLFLFYPGASNTILKTFNCVDFDNVFQGVFGDLSVQCDSSAYQAYRQYAAAMVALFIIMIPLGLLALLLRSQMRLNPQASRNGFYQCDVDGLHQRNGDDTIQWLRMSFAPFEPFFFWFEPVDLVRKLFQTGIPILVPTLQGQIIFQFSAAVISSIVLIELKPYANWDDDVLASVSQVCLAAISFISLVTAMDSTFVNSTSANTAMFCIIFIPIALAVFQIVWLIMKSRTEGTRPGGSAFWGKLCERWTGKNDEKKHVGGYGGKFDFETEPTPMDNTVTLS